MILSLGRQLRAVFSRFAICPAPAAVSSAPTRPPPAPCSSRSWAAENKLVNGLGDNKFGPNNYVTREQAALILFNYLKRDYTLTVSDEFLNKAPDKASVSSWALEAMKWATGAALMRGDANGTLRPRYSATRAKIATIFKRFIEIKEDLEANKPDGPLGCDHVWETTETKRVNVFSEDVEDWVLVKDIRPMSICNGCGLDIYQWYVDNRDNYKTVADATTALSFLADETGCPAGHVALNNFHDLDQVIPIIETKTYAAELPVMKKCTLCGTTKPWSIEDISNRDIWIEHTKEVVVCETWDEELYIDEDSTKLDENYNEIPVPAGSLIDTILPVMSTMKSNTLKILTLARKSMLQYLVANIQNLISNLVMKCGIAVLNVAFVDYQLPNFSNNI